MPNNIHNRICFESDAVSGEPLSDGQLNRILTTLKGGRQDADIDFNVLVPMPESLNVEASSRGEQAHKAYTQYVTDKAQLTPEQINLLADHETFKLGKQYYDNEQAYGHTTWYGWCCANWGTKWNAYDTEAGPNYIAFNTAWSDVTPLVKRISERFPWVKIEYEHADMDDFGGNVGRHYFAHGHEVDWDIPDSYTSDAYEMAAGILGEDLEEMGFVYVNGEWKFDEER